MSIITIDKVKGYLGITSNDHDVLLTDLLDYAESSLKNHLGFNIEEDEVTQTFVTDGVKDTFLLKAYPVNVEEDFTVSVDEEVVDSSSYEVNYPLGILKMNTPPACGINKLTVVYHGGYTAGTMPGDLKMALTMMVADLFNSRGTESGRAIKSEKLGDYSVTYVDGIEVGNSIANILKKYIRTSI